jgi:hypothetical protein
VLEAHTPRPTDRQTDRDRETERQREWVGESEWAGEERERVGGFCCKGRGQRVLLA